MSDQKNQIFCSDLDSCKEGVSLIRHILVPYDDSGYSNRAFVFGLDLAKKYGAILSVISVMYSNPKSTEIRHQTVIDKDRVNIMKKSFNRLEMTAKKFGVSIRTELIMKSEIVDSIVSYTSAKNVDLIVMGTRGRGGPKRLMFGSVAMATSQKAPCPVTLVK